MIAWMITASLFPSTLDEAVTRFSEVILPRISRERGYKSSYVMTNAAQTRLTVMIFWETEADAAANLSQPLLALGSLLAEPGAETLDVILRA